MGLTCVFVEREIEIVCACCEVDRAPPGCTFCRLFCTMEFLGDYDFDHNIATVNTRNFTDTSKVPVRCYGHPNIYNIIHKTFNKIIRDKSSVNES
jgi:hypothetical protein